MSGRPPDPPAPSPDMVTASRRHLTERYAVGVDRLLWELEKRTMPDTEAIRAVISAASADEAVDALDIGAALVTMQAIRLEMDLLEADVLDAAEAGRIPAESLAAVLELPGADAVDARRQMLTAKRKLPRALPEQVAPSPAQGHRAAAERAGRRAGQAANRAAAAGRRREQLRQAQAAQPSPLRQDADHRHADQAGAYASEARVNAKDAAERVALGLLRAAEALDRCAARCGEWEGRTAPGSQQEQLRERAGEYAQAARSYREMADRYRDIGSQIPKPPDQRH